MPKFIFWLERKLAAGLLRLLRKTLRFEVSGQPPDRLPCVYAFWHRNLINLVIQRIGSGVFVLVSASQDGELIAGPLAELGYGLVRGSSTRGGSQALKELVRLSRDHGLAITPDGPKGPHGTVKEGILQLALLARIPIIPINADCDREWVFNTWDRLRLPKPFAHIKIKYGPELWVRDKEDFGPVSEQLRASLNGNPEPKHR